MRRWLGLVVWALTATGYAAMPNSIHQVTMSTIPKVVEFDGNVQPVNRGTVAAQTSGTVVGVLAQVNDIVAKGTPLLEISSVEQQAQLNSAIAALNSAEARNNEAQSLLKRYQTLLPKGAISQEQLDSAIANAKATKAAVTRAQAAVDQARERLGYTKILAPYAGIVTERHVELGESVAPGTPLLSGFALDKLRVEVALPQVLFNQVKQADQFSIITPNSSVLIPVSTQLFHYADSQSHTFTLRLNLADNVPDLMPGMWVKVRFYYGQRNALFIPQDFVVQRGEFATVYVKQQQHKIMVPIRLGARYGEMIEVLSGLRIGDLVVANPLNEETHQ